MAGHIGHERADSKDVRSRDVIAVDPSPSVLDRATRLGFTVSAKVELQALGATVVKLSAPASLSAVAGLQLLEQQIAAQPDQSGRLVFNHEYHLIKEAAAGPARVRKARAGIPVTEPCVSDHCYGRSMVVVTPENAVCAMGRKIGIIDTPVDLSHPAFIGRHITRRDFKGEGHIAADSAHGTAVLALLAGDPDSDTPGLIPDAQFLVANVFYTDERGELTADTASMLGALDWMAREGVEVVNMSFTGPRDPAIEAAIKTLSERGMVFVAAGGNGGPAADPSFPAAYPDVIAVTAVDKSLRNYRYANRGSYISLAAPGVDIWTAEPNGHAGYKTGTSFAAPHVAAILAVDGIGGPNASKQSALQALSTRDLGDAGADPVFGNGLAIANEVPANCGVRNAPSVAMGLGFTSASAGSMPVFSTASGTVVAASRK